MTHRPYDSSLSPSVISVKNHNVCNCVSDDFGDFSNEPTSHQQPPTQSNNPTPPTQNDSFGGGGGGGLSLGAQFLSLCNETLGDQGGLGQEKSVTFDLNLTLSQFDL